MENTESVTSFCASKKPKLLAQQASPTRCKYKRGVRGKVFDLNQTVLLSFFEFFRMGWRPMSAFGVRAVNLIYGR
jgi:hypothetical protein